MSIFEVTGQQNSFRPNFQYPPLAQTTNRAVWLWPVVMAVKVSLSSAVTATGHCDRLIAQRRTLTGQESSPKVIVVVQSPSAASGPSVTTMLGTGMGRSGGSSGERGLLSLISRSRAVSSPLPTLVVGGGAFGSDRLSPPKEKSFVSPKRVRKLNFGEFQLGLGFDHPTLEFRTTLRVLCARASSGLRNSFPSLLPSSSVAAAFCAT